MDSDRPVSPFDDLLNTIGISDEVQPNHLRELLGLQSKNCIRIIRALLSDRTDGLKIAGKIRGQTGQRPSDQKGIEQQSPIVTSDKGRITCADGPFSEMPPISSPSTRDKEQAVLADDPGQEGMNLSRGGDTMQRETNGSSADKMINVAFEAEGTPVSDALKTEHARSVRSIAGHPGDHMDPPGHAEHSKITLQDVQFHGEEGAIPLQSRHTSIEKTERFLKQKGPLKRRYPPELSEKAEPTESADPLSCPVSKRGANTNKVQLKGLSAKGDTLRRSLPSPEDAEASTVPDHTVISSPKDMEHFVLREFVNHSKSQTRFSSRCSGTWG
jgi:hypothetical protein